jgi:mono/diheme cytochrome c family protein
MLGAACGLGLGGTVLVFADGPSPSARASVPGPVQFNRDIRPVLSDNCFQCHGPDSAQRKADLRLDTAEGLFGRAGENGTVVHGKPEDSELYQRIIAESPNEIMPPPKSHKKLTPEQKDLVRRWIAEGAVWEPHWSFVVPQRPAVPKPKDAAWVRNPIDAFILAKLESVGLTPAAPADRRTLLRRWSLDITGLPPAPAEVEAFVGDTSPDAEDKVLDRLFASPHWGEHRGRYWLDAARYADTHGLHIDNYREMWAYRDWVIAAFNRNMPFDQFTIEQLAGDLLPNPTLEQRIASGFHRCNITTNEGGVIPAEVDAMYQKDRVETTGTVFLGLTLGCAVCHDHKFDPFTMRDFYSLVAYFKNTTQNPMDGNVHDSPPVLFVPKSEDRSRWDALQPELAQLKQKMRERKDAAQPAFKAWLAKTQPAALKGEVKNEKLAFHAPLAEGKGDALGIAIHGEPMAVTFSKLGWTAGPAANKAFNNVATAVAEFPSAGDFERDQPFSAAVWFNVPRKEHTGSIVARMDEANGHRGWDLWLEGGRVGMHLIHEWDRNALKVVSKNMVPDAKVWHHLAVTYDGSGKAQGLRIYLDGELQQVDVHVDRLSATTRTKVPLKLGQRHAGARIDGLGLSDLRLYERPLSEGEIAALHGSALLARLLAVSEEKRTGVDHDRMFAWWQARFDEPSQALARQLADLQKEEQNIRRRGAVTHVMQEKANSMPKARILFRGQYDQPRDEVVANVPTALHPLPKDAPTNRLGLARWLLASDNPLTARVTVNRFWQEVFGTGLVKTSEDFGIMGEHPSHPELLDWLAVEFRESGWDIKRFYRLLLTSATYRQAATATPEKLKKDPNNRLLSRGPRFRLDAELIRDHMLAASGLLVPKIGGPSVKPYQPPGVWEAVAMKESNTRMYQPDVGEGLYRRSLYTFWKRSAPPASMEILNAPSRENCTVRRERTNTPLQSLVLMNDPQLVEAARHLAQRSMREGPQGFDPQLDFITLHVLARKFAGKERDICQTAWSDFKRAYEANPEAAKQLVEVGASRPDAKLPIIDLAAWTMLANKIMNLDEAINK